MIKAIFFDIDSTTFLHSIHDCPTSTKKAFKKLKDNGFKLAICTSRSMAEMVNLPVVYHEYMDAIVCLAGAQIYINDELVINHSLDDEVNDIIRLLDDKSITYRYSAKNQDNFLNVHDKDVEGIFYHLYTMIPDVKKYENEELVHMIYYPDSKELIEKVKSMCHKNYHLTLGRCCEIVPPGINKGTGIAECARIWGIEQSEIAAFGDGNNDVEMIETASVGIAMGNAAERLKDVADYITDTIDNDGVYKACVHFKWIEEE
ncbi:MAG: HAD family hydrolase [Erysipelotrichaceae bacterium]|nr:HAD family hydrolase [Erysipelotrichaceae bacterium]